MQAARGLVLRQWGERTLRGPLWERLVASTQARSVQSSAGSSGVERKDGPVEVDEWLVDRRGFASAAAPEDGVKSQKGYWRDLVKERLDEELEPGAEAKDVAEGTMPGVESSRRSDGADAKPSDVPSSDASPPLEQSPPEQSLGELSPSPEQPNIPLAPDSTPLNEERPLEQPKAAVSRPAAKVFKPKPRQDPPPRRPRAATDSESATAWMERLLEKQKELTAQRQAAEAALRGGVLRPESGGGVKETVAVEKVAGQDAPVLAPTENKRLDQNAPLLKSAEREQLDIAKRFAETEGLGAETVKSLEPEVGLPQLSADGKRLADAAKVLKEARRVASRAEVPTRRSDELEQLSLAKGFAKVEGLPVEEVTGLEREVGLPPLEEPPKASTSRGVERTGISAPPGVRRTADDPLGGSRKKSEDERLSAAAKILAAIGSAEGEAVLREVESARRKDEPPVMVEPQEVLGITPNPVRVSDSADRARAAAEVFEQMQHAGSQQREVAVAPKRAERVPEPVLEQQPALEPEVTPGPVAVETLPEVEGVLQEVGGAQVLASETPEASEASEDWSEAERIVREADAIARVPESMRDPLKIAADLQKISLGWDDENQRSDGIDVAYVYPNVLAADEELEWAAQALHELIHAEEPPPLAGPPPKLEEEEGDEEEEEDWFLSPYERERKRRAAAPVPQHQQQEDEVDEVIPPKNFRFVSQRAHPLNIGFLDNFIDEHGSIIPRRITGLRKKDQNKVERAIKTARQMGLLPILSDLDWRHPTILRLFPPVPEDMRDENQDDDVEGSDEEDEEDEDDDMEDEDWDDLEEEEAIQEYIDSREWQEVTTLESEVPAPESKEYEELGPVITSVDVGTDVYEIRDITGTEFVPVAGSLEGEELALWEEYGEGEEDGNSEELGEGEDFGNGQEVGIGEGWSGKEGQGEGEELGEKEGKLGGGKEGIEVGPTDYGPETPNTEAPETGR